MSAIEASDSSGSPRGGGGGTPRKMGGGVRPASQNPYPIYDQNLQYSLPYLRPDQKFENLYLKDPSIKILFQTGIIISSPVQTNVKLS